MIEKTQDKEKTTKYIEPHPTSKKISIIKSLEKKPLKKGTPHSLKLDTTNKTIKVKLEYSFLPLKRIS